MAKSVKEREKVLQEKHQALLSGLLRDEDNKYCADCHAKGPRWASWNLGVFLCIRCAGIHRNLGVHISRVKSVNLDSWTPEQMFMVQEVGNSRAMAVYEANVPDGFRRPQTDSALEIFIRDKYERKRYIAREWIPPKPPSKINETAHEEKKREKRVTNKTSRTPAVQLNNVSRPKSSSQSTNGVLAAPGVTSQTRTPVRAPSKPTASADLLGLHVESTPASNAAAAQPANNDLFGDFLSADTSPAPTAQTTPPGDKPSDDLNDPSLLSEKPKSTKDSIMALFASGGNNQQQFYGVPGNTASGPSPLSQRSTSPSMGQAAGVMGFGEGGMYMGPQPQPTPTSQHQTPNPYMMNGAMMTSQQGMMTSPMPGMMSQQGMMASQPGLMASQPGMMTSQAGMMASQAGMMASQPGMMTSQAGMMAGQQGMMASQPGMMASPMPGMGVYQGQQPGMMPNLAHQMSHQVSMNPPAMMMMGGQMPQSSPAIMNQQMMMNQQQQQQANMMNPQQLQQVQHQMASMRLASPAQSMVGIPKQGTVTAGSGWGGAQTGNTLSNNLWQ